MHTRFSGKICRLALNVVTGFRGTSSNPMGGLHGLLWGEKRGRQLVK